MQVAMKILGYAVSAAALIGLGWKARVIYDQYSAEYDLMMRDCDDENCC